MTIVKHPLIVVMVFVWTGFVCAISFMEAWLKFRAEGVTLPIGLSIGRMVFKALNRVEWVFALSVLLCLVLNKEKWILTAHFFFLAAFAILIIQTAWLLPALDARAANYIQRLSVGNAPLHIYFVAGEALKVCCLVVFGVLNFKSL